MHTPPTDRREKVLLVDHLCHKKTHSFDFFASILQRDFEVSYHYYEKHYDCHLTRQEAQKFDYIIYLEFLPGRYRICIPGRKTIFLPMYDNEWGSKWQWKRIALSGMSVISFCRRVSDLAHRQGVSNLLTVQYFPNQPDDAKLRGNPAIVLFWDRGSLSFEIVKKLLNPEKISKVIVLRHSGDAPPVSTISDYDLSAYHVEIKETGFMPRDEYLRTIREAGTVIAPREKEGIGMAFLEAMAMGKCVIANDDATMNEYIDHGVNGILYNTNNPRQVDFETIRRVWQSGINTEQMKASWAEDAPKIVPFIRNAQEHHPRQLARVVDALYYALFLVEAFVMRTRFFLSRRLTFVQSRQHRPC